MAAASWFYNENGRQVGPVTQEQICGLFATGKLGLSTPVWCAQFKDWTEASKIKAFRELVRQAPPPLPDPPPFASVVAPPPGLTSVPPPLPPQENISNSPPPFGSPVAAPQPVFIPGLGAFPGGAAPGEPSPAEMAKLYPAAPATSGPPLMTPHPHREEDLGPVAVDADGYPIAEPSPAAPWVRLFLRSLAELMGRGRRGRWR